MTSVATVMAVSAAVALGMMLAVWLLSLRLRDASIVDSFWGLGFVAIAWAVFVVADGYEPRKLLVCLLVTIWGLRLSLHLARRNRGEPEDFRYQAMRRRHGDRFWLVSLPTVFLLQGAAMWTVSLPVQLAQTSASPDHLTALDLLGAAVFAAGLAFEASADRQLERFKADPTAAGVLDTGLWRYSRHPNYFGDALLWWGLFVIALSNAEHAWTAIGPLLMTVLLMRVSGVPVLEKRLSRTRPGYAEYVERTSAFFPRPPRRAGAGKQ